MSTRALTDETLTTAIPYTEQTLTRALSTGPLELSKQPTRIECPLVQRRPPQVLPVRMKKCSRCAFSEACSRRTLAVSSNTSDNTQELRHELISTEVNSTRAA